jgi:hypothetical protein
MAFNSYAKRLTPRVEKGGGLGIPEKEDEGPRVSAKIVQASLILSWAPHLIKNCPCSISFVHAMNKVPRL